MVDSPGVRRSGRARQQTTTVYDEARAKAEEEEAELSDAASASSTSSPPRGAGTKGKGKGKGARATKKATAAAEEASSDDEEGSVASASASKKRKRRSSSSAAAKPKPKPKPAAKTAGKSKGKGKKAVAAETSDDDDSDDDDSGSEAGLDKLMDERRGGAKGGKKGGKGGGGKGGGWGGGRAAPLSKLKEGETTCVLFEHLARNVPVEQRMKAWVRAWLAEEAEREESGEEEEGGGPCVIDMFNFLLWCAGARKSYADREAELLPEVDSAEWEALMGGVVQDLREGGGPNYPLLEKTAKHRGFRERFAQAWHALVGAARDGHRHHVEALRRVLEVVHGLCECPLVSVRHTACYAGLQLGDALVRETVALSNKADVAARQLEAERRKGAGKGRKAKDLGRDIDEYAAHVSELEAVLEEVFNSIFATRYRDVNERVRVDCLEGLGAFLRRYPSMFLKDQFIKYLGWMLYDKADAVRAAAARVLLGLYAGGGNLPKLENFTARFLGRMQGLVHDVDEGVRVLAVRILRRLQAAGYLDEAEQEQLDEVDELLLDPAWGLPLRKEATLFFADHVDGFNDEEGDGEEAEDDVEEEDDDESGAEMEEEDGNKGRRRSSAASKASSKGKGGSKKKGKGGGRKSTGSAAAAKGGGARARRGVMRRLVTVVQFLDYHLRPGMAEDGEEEEQAVEGEQPWPEAYDRLVATCVESFEQHPQGGFLYDWPTYFALLQDPAGPVAQPNVAGGLTDREQALLIRLMAAAVKRAAAAGAGGGAWVQAEATKAKEPPAVTGAGLQAGAGGGKADKPLAVTAAECAAARARQEGLAAALEAFTSGAVEELPKVLRRYKTDAGKLAGLVALPRFLQREAIAGKRHKGHFEALLKLLKEVYLQGTDPAALRDVAAALAHLRAEDEARVHNVGAVLQAVVGDLLGRLAGDSTASGEAEEEEEADDDADFNTGLVLLQLGTLAKRLDLAEFLGDGNGGGAEALQQQLGEEATEALAERVRGVVQARLAGAPEAWGKGFGQALEWRVRVVKEGMQLLYLLLLHSTRGLLRLAMEQRPAESEEAKTKKATAKKGAGKGKKKKGKGEEEDKEEEDDEEEAGADEELVEGDEDVGVEEAELVLKQRKTLLAVLSAVLSMGSQEAAIQEEDQEEEGEESASQGEASEGEGSQQSQPPARKRKGGKGGKGMGKGKAGAGGVSEEVAKAVAEVKTAAYALASDLRFLFRSGIGRYQVLRRVVWAPEPEFLRLLQGHFQREELRYQEAAMRAEAQDKPEEADAADVALVRDLLDPLIRSVLYTTEALNRRQAAAIAAHFVHSGPRAAESVKYLLKRLKELDVRSYLEVHMTTLRTCFAKWGAGASDAGMDRFVQLAHRMAQALGVGKLPHATAAHQQLLDSFVRFLKNGVQYATDDAPHRFAFFEGLRFYLAKLPEHKVRDVARLFEERAQALPPAVRAQLEEEQERLEEEPEALVSAEGAWFLTFQQDLAALLDAANGKGKGKGGKGTPSSSAKKRSPRSPRRSSGSAASASGGSGKKRARSRSRSTSRSRSPAPNRRGGGDKVSAAEALGHEGGDDEADPIVAADSDEDEEASMGGGGRGKGRAAGRGAGGCRRGSASTLASVREGEKEEDEEIEEEDEQPKGRRASQSQRSGKRRRVSAAASQSSNLDALDESEGEEGGSGGAGGGGDSDGEDSVFGEMGPSQKAAAAAAADAKGKGKKGGRK